MIGRWSLVILAAAFAAGAGCKKKSPATPDSGTPDGSGDATTDVSSPGVAGSAAAGTTGGAAAGTTGAAGVDGVAGVDGAAGTAAEPEGPLSKAPIPRLPPRVYWPTTVPVVTQVQPAAAAGAPVCYPSGWCWSLPLPLGGRLAVSARAANDVWVAGPHGVVRRFDGATWTTLPLATDKSLEDIVAVAPNDVWVTASGFLSHWDGTKWTASTQPDIGGTQLSARAADDIWLGGDGSMTWHFDGKAWTLEPFFLFGTEDVSPASNGAVYAVTDGLRIAYRPPGGVFDYLPVDGNKSSPASIWGAAPNDIWLAHALRLVHFDGTAWQDPPVAFPSEIWAPQLRRVRGSDANNVWVASMDGSMLRWNGTRLERWTTGAAYLDKVSARVANDVWAGGWSGALAHFDGAGWRNHFSGPQLLGPSVLGQVGAGADEIWAVGNYNPYPRIVRYRASTGWQEVPSALPQGEYLALWGSGPNDVWLSAINREANTPLIVHWDGAAWSHAVGLPQQFAYRAIWGTSATDVWIVGNEVRRWNGTDWTVEEIPGGAGRAWWAIAGSGKNDVWLAAYQAPNQPSVFQWNGTKWSAHPNAGLGTKLAVRAPNDVFVASETDIRHWNGTSWTTIRDGIGADSISARAGELWAIAGGQVDVWDGAKWTRSDVLREFDKLLATPTDVWVATIDGSGGGSIMRKPK